ncbi:hypothetical protein [Burkholderia sp. S171]|uniref:hypothetical protein n=1 Tax=Burkholderia sp. S171 TaxID=1641860 RepID=UPI00131C45DD|nr:hypothetical protein [Burkholderia sp. S171]
MVTDPSDEAIDLFCWLRQRLIQPERCKIRFEYLDGIRTGALLASEAVTENGALPQCQLLDCARSGAN